MSETFETIDDGNEFFDDVQVPQGGGEGGEAGEATPVPTDVTQEIAPEGIEPSIPGVI